MKLLRERLNRRRYRKAAALAAENDGQVCATVLADGKPEYFVMPKDADSATISERAFEIRHGRPVSQGERVLLDMARARIAEKQKHVTPEHEVVRRGA